MLSFDQVKDIVNSELDPRIEAARKMKDKLRLHVDGIGLQSFLARINNYENAGQCAGKYIVAMLEKYDVTGDSKALDNARRSFKAIELLWNNVAERNTYPGGRGWMPKPFDGIQNIAEMTECSPDQYTDMTLGLEHFHRKAADADERKVIEEMIRVTKPGGAILILAEPDYGGRIDFPEELTIIGEWQQAALHRQGADPLIGRQLAALLHQSGLQKIEVGVIGAQWSSPPSEIELASEWEVIRSDLEYLDANSELLHSSKELSRSDSDAWTSGARTLFVPTFFGLGWVPGSS